MRLMEAGTATRNRAREALADAGSFLERYLWEAETCRAARESLFEKGLSEKTIRAFGVGYAPVGPDELFEHLRELGYTTEDLLAAGVAVRSRRDRLHSHFRSRVMFPVRDADGGILGFAGLSTHLGPSWPLWLFSPETQVYRRAEAIFGLDRAARRIASSGEALVLPDCIEAMRAHQERRTNAVAVHSSDVTPAQQRSLAAVAGVGVAELELDLPPGMEAEPEEAAAPEQEPARRAAPREPAPQPRFLALKRFLIVAATAVATMSLWTSVPLLAVWVGSQVQAGEVVALRGVVAVLVVMGLLAYLLGWALVWLHARYDELTGRPAHAGQTSPWHRAKRGDRVQDIRSRFGISAPEKAVAACVAAGFLVLEIWFFLFAGSSLPV